MPLISHTDYDIEFNKWNDAIVTHYPTGMVIIGCGQKEKWQNLYSAMDALEKIIKAKLDSNE